MERIAKGANVIIAILWIILGLGFLSLTWDWIIIFAGQLSGDDFFYALFYISAITMIFLTIFLPPIALITSAFKEETL